MISNKMTREEIRRELRLLGLHIQTERPLHEAPMSYLEPLGFDKSNYYLEWWKRHPEGCSDPIWEGRNHLTKAYKEAMRLVLAVKSGRYTTGG